ncbi:hypothetical protein ACOMCU_01385 [Lysinibacillus sp. UGB7]|uniref:hypothetical protein n=1 Tax=Lysinibacillus sp. UGB7 TaxID=3411039 RepID=UPI003B7E60E0
MNFERGDSVKFGEKWCEEHGRKELINQIVKFSPQWFEDDNGLYTYDVECPGIYDEVNKEADSIYHLFGNNFEKFMDCELVKGTAIDKEEYQKIIQDKIEAEAKHWDEYVKNI